MKKYKWSDVRITDWSYEVFAGLTAEAQLKKLEEEIIEADKEYGVNVDRWIEEMADVSIVASILEYRFRSKIGRVVWQYIDALPEHDKILTARDVKMDINVNRQWINQDGVYRHVEEVD